MDDFPAQTLERIAAAVESTLNANAMTKLPISVAHEVAKAVLEEIVRAQAEAEWASMLTPEARSGALAVAETIWRAKQDLALRDTDDLDASIEVLLTTAPSLLAHDVHAWDAAGRPELTSAPQGAADGA